MDLGAAALAVTAFILGGIFNAVVAAASAEFKAARDESRQTAREKIARVRSHHVAEIDRADQVTSADLLRLMAQAADNRRVEEDPELRGGLVGFGADYAYLGDADLVRDYLSFEASLFYRSRGAGFSAEDYQKWLSVSGRVGRALRENRRRVLQDEPPILVPQDVLDTIPSWREQFERRIPALARSGTHSAEEARPTDLGGDEPEVSDG